MSITSPDSRIAEYAPVVPTTDFPATFPVFDNDDIKVFVNGVERDDFAVSATYVEGISTNAKAVFSVGVTGAVHIVGARDPHRTNRFNNGGPLPIRDQNLALDTITAEMQEAARDIGRAHKAPFGESGSIFSAADVANAQENAASAAASEAAAKASAELALAAANSQATFNTRALAVDATIPDGVTSLRLNGGAAEGDGLGGLFIDTDSGSTDTFESADGRTWYRVRTEELNVKWFGAKGDGVNDDGAAIQSALTLAGFFRSTVLIPAGVYLVSQELKVPSNVVVTGSVMWQTTVRAANGFHPNSHVFTNAKNDRASRTDYDEGILICDLTVDANCYGRKDAGTPREGITVCFSTVRHSRIARVRVINNMLHGIDVMASQYLDTGSIVDQPAGPSLFVDVEDCIADHTYLDDGITTHNSGFINLRRCKSFFSPTTEKPEPSQNQNGIETDEGSYNITVDDCYSEGWYCGYQAKGHGTTRPALDIKFLRCFSKNVAFGFQVNHAVSTGELPFARSVLIKDCTVDGLVAYTTGGTTLPRVVQVSGYRSVVVDGLDIYNHGTGCLSLAQGITDAAVAYVNDIHFRNIRVHSTGTLQSGAGSPPEGFVHVYSGIGGTPRVFVEKLRLFATQPRSAVRCSSGSAVISIDDVVAWGSDNTIAAIDIQPTDNARVRGVRHTGYSGSILLRGVSSTVPVDSTMNIEFNRVFTCTASGSPEGSVYAPIGATCFATGSGATFRKATGSGVTNTGWVEIPYAGSSLYLDDSTLWLNAARNVFIKAGTGTPEGVVTANSGSLFLRLDGAASTSLYLKTTDGVNTGWVAK